MNTLLNMDPWGFLDEIFDTGSRTFRTMRARAAGRFPPVNVFLDDDAVLIDVELPGKTAADVDLSLEPQAVIIAGKKTPTKAKVEGEGVDEGRGEERQPTWSRRLDLPFRINPEKANAKFTNGILRIELPKTEAAGVRKIAIQ